MAINSGFPWRDNDIRRGLMLVRTSNNAHNFINIEVLTEKVDALPLAARRELVDTLRSITEGINLGIAAEVAGSMPKKAVDVVWYYVTAEEQNPNSNKLQGWFPSRALAQMHKDSWPAFIGDRMRIFEEEYGPYQFDRVSPSDMNTAVAQALYAFYKENDMQPSKYLNGNALKIAEAALKKQSFADGNGHVLYRKGDPNVPDVIQDRNGDIVLGMCKLCGRAEVDLEEKCSGAGNTPPICETVSAAEDAQSPVAMLWGVQQHTTFALGERAKWGFIAPPKYSSFDDAENLLDEIERNVLDDTKIYRVWHT